MKLNGSMLTYSMEFLKVMLRIVHNYQYPIFYSKLVTNNLIGCRRFSSLISNY